MSTQMKLHFGVQRTVLYTNWKGEKRVRRIIPHYLWFGVSEFHAGPQWHLRVWDTDKESWRDFAIKDIEEYEAEVDGGGRSGDESGDRGGKEGKSKSTKMMSNPCVEIAEEIAAKRKAYTAKLLKDFVLTAPAADPSGLEAISPPSPSLPPSSPSSPSRPRLPYRINRQPRYSPDPANDNWSISIDTKNNLDQMSFTNQIVLLLADPHKGVVYEMEYRPCLLEYRGMSMQSPEDSFWIIPAGLLYARGVEGVKKC